MMWEVQHRAGGPGSPSVTGGAQHVQVLCPFWTPSSLHRGPAMGPGWLWTHSCDRTRAEGGGRLVPVFPVYSPQRCVLSVHAA